MGETTNVLSVTNITILKYRKFVNYKTKTESLGNSKQISHTSRTFEWAFPLKSFGNFRMPDILEFKDPCSAVGHVDIAIIKKASDLTNSGILLPRLEPYVVEFKEPMLHAEYLK